MPTTEDEEEPTCPCKKDLFNPILIDCSECSTRWHPVCCGLDGLTQQPITKLMNKNWKCPRCFKFPEYIPSQYKQQNQQQQKTKLTEETVTDIITIVNSTVEHNLKALLSQENLNEENLDMDNPNNQGIINNEVPFTEVLRRSRRNNTNTFQAAVQEQREEDALIEKKKDNLIVYGMPETPGDDRKEELLEDFRRIKKIYTGRTEVVKEDIVHMTRLGQKAANKIRPIQITLVNQTKRKNILTKNRDLKLLENDISTNIYVSTDRTQKQREADKILRRELKERQKTNPDLVIRNNKIVTFQPAAQATTTWASLFD